MVTEPLVRCLLVSWVITGWSRWCCLMLSGERWRTGRSGGRPPRGWRARARTARSPPSASALKHPRARLDAERVEQLGELAVKMATEFGDDRIGEAGVHRARLV